MGFLSNAVAQMVANMDPTERREAITTVTAHALALMSSEERFELTKQLFDQLLNGLAPAERAHLAAALSAGLPVEEE